MVRKKYIINKIINLVIRKIKLYQDPVLDEEGRPITKPLTSEEEMEKEKNIMIMEKYNMKETI